MGPEPFLQVSQALDRTHTFGSVTYTWEQAARESTHCLSLYTTVGQPPQVSPKARARVGTLRTWRMSSALLFILS